MTIRNFGGVYFTNIVLGLATTFVLKCEILLHIDKMPSSRAPLTVIRGLTVDKL